MKLGVSLVKKLMQYLSADEADALGLWVEAAERRIGGEIVSKDDHSDYPFTSAEYRRVDKTSSPGTVIHQVPLWRAIKTISGKPEIDWDAVESGLHQVRDWPDPKEWKLRQ